MPPVDSKDWSKAKRTIRSFRTPPTIHGGEIASSKGETLQ